MRIQLASVFVDDQEKALAFYTEILGFVKKTDIPAGEFRWLTVVSPEGSGEIELVLEPNVHPAAQAYQSAIYGDGIPATVFMVEDLDQECERLRGLGVVFKVQPTQSEWGFDAILDDTCGNLIGLHQD